MKKCATMNCEETNIVYSGIDAMMLGGIPTETYCYRCATAYVMISNAVESRFKL
jgi:hypothetical protein